MAEITLKAATGRELGNGPARRLRAAGQIPGVVYGLGAEPIPVAVDWRPLREALTTEAGLNALIDLDIDGDVALTIVKELQRHPIRGDVLHIDFLRVSADAAITVDVPVVLEGEAKAVESENGVVDHVLVTLAISAKPADIPNEITVDISGLTIGDAIRVGDLSLPAGVTSEVDADDPVVTASFGEVAEVEETEGAEGEGAEGEPAAEGAGDAAEAAGGDEG
ncbi:MAG: 50S ribosomal protein L25 [Acidimicrobiales bacterium]|nr:50S ribosomal protein L25 [Acidimicrobiales bacterium]HRW36356.1 50S ribosomal protein L25 [Aquihabitans sp.]